MFESVEQPKTAACPPCRALSCALLRWWGRTGAKLFYLSGLRNGKFLAREVLNLARFISVMKFRPLTWRLAHPYLLTDRFEVGSQSSRFRFNTIPNK